MVLECRSEIGPPFSMTVRDKVVEHDNRPLIEGQPAWWSGQTRGQDKTLQVAMTRTREGRRQLVVSEFLGKELTTIQLPITQGHYRLVRVGDSRFSIRSVTPSHSDAAFFEILSKFGLETGVLKRRPDPHGYGYGPTDSAFEPLRGRGLRSIFVGMETAPDRLWDTISQELFGVSLSAMDCLQIVSGLEGAKRWIAEHLNLSVAEAPAQAESFPWSVIPGIRVTLKEGGQWSQLEIATRGARVVAESDFWHNPGLLIIWCINHYGGTKAVLGDVLTPAQLEFLDEIHEAQRSRGLVGRVAFILKHWHVFCLQHSSYRRAFLFAAKRRFPQRDNAFEVAMKRKGALIRNAEEMELPQPIPALHEVMGISEGTFLSALRRALPANVFYRRRCQWQRSRPIKRSH